MCVVALGMMARAVEISTEFNQGYGTAALHAQVAFDRISRAVSGASNNAQLCRHLGDAGYGRQLHVSRHADCVAASERHADESDRGAAGE